MAVPLFPEIIEGSVEIAREELVITCDENDGNVSKLSSSPANACRAWTDIARQDNSIKLLQHRAINAKGRLLKMQI